MITMSEPLVEAAVPEFIKRKPSTKERSSTELRFASFPLPLCGTARAVKGRDERPPGALDSPLRPFRGRVVVFLLDEANDFIDGGNAQDQAEEDNVWEFPRSCR